MADNRTDPIDRVKPQSQPADAADAADRTPATARSRRARRSSQRQRDDFHDRLLRKTAEFDNYRKRIERERQAHAEAAAADLLQELLPLVDDLERALQAEAGAEGADAVSARRRADPPPAADLLRKRGVTADRGARRRLRSALPSGGRPRAGGRAARRRSHRGVPPRLHARRSAAAAGDGEGGER